MRPSGISSRQFAAMQTRVWTLLTLVETVQSPTQTKSMSNAFYFKTLLQIVRKWVSECTLKYLLMWIDVDVAFDTFLSHVGPGVAAHPLPLTLGALVLSKTSLLPLVGCETLTFGSGLKRKINKTLTLAFLNRRIKLSGVQKKCCAESSDLHFLSLYNNGRWASTAGCVHTCRANISYFHTAHSYTQFWHDRWLCNWHLLPLQLC